MKQLEVQIMGQSYLLGCPHGGEAPMLAAVQRVDAAMCRIRDAGKVRARDRIAVLAALNLAFELAEKSGADSQGTQADNPTAQSPTSVTGAAQTAASANTATPPSPAVTASEEAALRALMQRLDNAMSQDGQLL